MPADGSTDVEFPVTPSNPGSARGPAVVLEEPVSFWGGVDPETGTIVDRHHPQFGVSVSGAVLCMPSGRGSSSGSSVLVEMVRLGTAPVGIVLGGPDEVVALGSIVADELYGQMIPVVIGDPTLFTEVATGDVVHIDNSTLRVTVE